MQKTIQRVVVLVIPAAACIPNAVTTQHALKGSSELEPSQPEIREAQRPVADGG